MKYGSQRSEYVGKWTELPQKRIQDPKAKMLNKNMISKSQEINKITSLLEIYLKILKNFHQLRIRQIFQSKTPPNFYASFRCFIEIYLKTEIAIYLSRIRQYELSTLLLRRFTVHMKTMDL